MTSSKTERKLRKNQLLAQRAALKAEKSARSGEQAARDERANAQLGRLKDLADSTRQALESQEAALHEKEAVLQRDLPPAEADAPPGGIGTRLRARFAKTRAVFAEGMERIVFGKKTIDGDLLAELEEMLIGADVGVATTGRLLEAIKARASRDETRAADRLQALLRAEITRILSRKYPAAAAAETLAGRKPSLALFVGVNGTGKTTTIGKFAAQHRARGEKVLLVAGDTFRAAATAQLAGWAERAGCEIFSSAPGAEPAGVMHQAVQKGVAEGFDLLLCDTAGRMHTKSNLMEELKKIRRVIGKALPGAPHETLLVLDGNTGQNAVLQTREFHRALDVTGLVITKLDGTARGGVVIGIVNEFDIPIRYIGIGETVQDLQPFDAERFAEELFD